MDPIAPEEVLIDATFTLAALRAFKKIRDYRDQITNPAFLSRMSRLDWR